MYLVIKMSKGKERTKVSEEVWKQVMAILHNPSLVVENERI